MEKLSFHPTCNKVSLTLTAKLVAFFDMCFGIFGLIWFVFMLGYYNIISLDPFENPGVNATQAPSVGSSIDPTDSDFGLPNVPSQSSRGFATSHKVISLSLVAFYTAVNLSVFVLLVVGVYKRSPAICLVWFHIRCAIFVFKLIILIIYFIRGRPFLHHIPFIFSMLVHLYGLWVVNCYSDELKQDKHQQQIEEYKERQLAASGGIGVTATGETREPDIFDIPNGIEVLLRERIMEGQKKERIEKEENEKK